MDITEAFGNKIEALEDGRIKITTPEGKTIIMGKDGQMQINLESISRVGFENIFDLKTHIIMRDGDLTVHQAEFHDGGKVKIAFTSQGKLVEFSANKIGQTITKDNEIVIRSHTAAEALKYA